MVLYLTEVNEYGDLHRLALTRGCTCHGFLSHSDFVRSCELELIASMQCLTPVDLEAAIRCIRRRSAPRDSPGCTGQPLCTLTEDKSSDLH